MYQNPQNRLKRDFTTGLFVVPVIAIIYLISTYWDHIKAFVNTLF